MNFERFIAIDWSGARPPGYRGVAVAECAADGAVRLVPPPEGRRWRRSSVLEWLVGEVARDQPLLIGFDFAFAFPFEEGTGYLPGTVDLMRTPGALWRFVDDVCGRQADLYAGAILENPDLARLFWRQGKRPDGFAERHRLTDATCRTARLGMPQSVFKLIGAAQVGMGSLAGMRLLHRLQRSPGLSIWPFADPQVGRSACVEIYPGLFTAKAGHRGKVRTEIDLSFVLNNLESRFELRNQDHLDDHCCDALVSAAALRYYAPVAEHWRPAAMTAAARRHEGWIFGLN